MAMRPAQMAAPSAAEQVDGDLVTMDELVERMELASPPVAVDTEKLRDLIAQMRRALREDEARDSTRHEQRRKSG
jgi:hypothetical protein